MDDMNEPEWPSPQQADPTDGSTRRRGPRVSGQQMRDVNRLRRSGTDRYIAGVAGGLGRHFDIDPTVIRVVLVVLTFFGGAGILLYGVIWLFVPEDGQDQRADRGHPDVAQIVLIVDGRGRADDRLRHPVLQSRLGLRLPVPPADHRAGRVRDLRHPRPAPPNAPRNQPPVPWGTPPARPTQPPQEGTTMSDTPDPPAPRPPATTDRAPTYGAPASRRRPGCRPPAPGYVPPPRPRRTGLVLFWPTLALIAIAPGHAGDLRHHRLGQPARRTPPWRSPSSG